MNRSQITRPLRESKRRLEDDIQTNLTAVHAWNVKYIEVLLYHIRL